MPLFRFRFSGDEAGDVDDGACEFPALEIAYLDAHRSMVEIGAGLLLDGKDPTSLAVEIFAEDGVSLMTLTYAEVFNRHRATKKRTLTSQTLRQRLDFSRELSVEINKALLDARAKTKEVRRLIAIARATTRRALQSS